MTVRDIIVLGASAGGVETLAAVVRGLPRNLPAAVFIVLHLPQDATSALPQILGRNANLPVMHAVDGAPVQPGQVFIAPTGHHLILEDGRMNLSKGPRENGHRPAVDALFRTAARAYGPRVIGVVLSGTGDDGTSGLQLIKALGGTAVVQSPDDAIAPEMPASAQKHVQVDAVVPLAELPALLVKLCRSDSESAVPGSPGAAVDEESEAPRIQRDKEDQEQGDRMNSPSVFSCPDCGGVLWEMEEGDLTRFRCHVGHMYSPRSLDAAHADALESAMWTAVRMFRERAMLARKGAASARDRGFKFLIANLELRAEDAERCATLIEDLLGQEHVGGHGDADSSEVG